MSLPKIPYEVRFNVFTDEKGKAFVVPDAHELTAMIEAAEADMQRIQARENTELTAFQSAELERVKAQRLALRDVYLLRCEAQTYRLACPTYGEYVAYRAFPGVRSLDTKTGLVVFDDEKLCDAMLPKCVEGFTEAQVKALHPDIAARLWLELKALVAPDAAILPIIA